MSSSDHATVTRTIVVALLKLPREEQREFMRLAVDYLRRESFTDVTSIHEFICGERSAIVSDERRAQLLSAVAKAIRDNDQSALMPAAIDHA